GEYGCSEAERWSAPFVPSAEDRRRLASLEQAGLLEREQAGDAIRIAGRYHCGRIRLPSGRHVDISSKVAGARLLEWLAFTGTLPELDDWTEDPSIGPGTEFADAIAALYVRELAHLTRF